MLDCAQPSGDPDPTAADLIARREALRLDALDGLLLDDVPLAQIAEDFGTPCWVYGADTIRRRYRRLRIAMPEISIHFAVKALDHLAVLSVLAKEGAGADVVSGGELLRALHAGVPAHRIVFSGVGKTTHELELALHHDIAQINVESSEELDELAAIAAGTGRIARVALRVNPDIDAATHDKIATGRAGDKFGVVWQDVDRLYHRASTMAGIEMVGLAVHIGSQLQVIRPFHAAYRRVAEHVSGLRAAGLSVQIVDCGGGLGIGYRDEPEPLPEAWAGAIQTELGGLQIRLAIEPGRWLVGPAGVLLASVVRTRRPTPDAHAGATPIVILDAAMNDLVRPAMYDAWHGIVPVRAHDLAAALAGLSESADIVGPVCETGDRFARHRRIVPLAPGAPVAILDAGAYGSVMSSPYNARPAAAQVLVEGGRAHLIRPRQEVAALWADEIVPGSLAQ